MPNHVKSRLEVIGAEKKMLEVVSHLKGEPFDDGSERKVDFNKIKPCPFCGKIPTEGVIGAVDDPIKTVRCVVDGCPLQEFIISLDGWQQKAL